MRHVDACICEHTDGQAGRTSGNGKLACLQSVGGIGFSCSSKSVSCPWVVSGGREKAGFPYDSIKLNTCWGAQRLPGGLLAPQRWLPHVFEFAPPFGQANTNLMAGLVVAGTNSWTGATHKTCYASHCSGLLHAQITQIAGVGRSARVLGGARWIDEARISRWIKDTGLPLTQVASCWSGQYPSDGMPAG